MYNLKLALMGAWPLNPVLEATASAFLAVGFSARPGQTHDESENEFVVGTKTVLSLPETNETFLVHPQSAIT
jgi:hypothetical protein